MEIKYQYLRNSRTVEVFFYPTISIINLSTMALPFTPILTCLWTNANERVVCYSPKLRILIFSVFNELINS